MRQIPQRERKLSEGLFCRLDVRWPFAFRSFCIRPLETIGSPIGRASTGPLWRGGGGDRAPGVPFEPVGPGPGEAGDPLSAQTPDLQTPRSHQETWADCLTRTFAPTWTRS